MSAPDGPVRPVYILLDTSGSTVRGGFAAGRGQAMPMLIDAAARHGGLLLAILVYSTQADTLVWLSDPADIKLIPEVPPAGLSSLAAGLRLLADSVRADAARLAADGIACLPPATLIVADGLPTDPAPALLEARSELDDAIADAVTTQHTDTPAGSLVPVFAAPQDTDQLAVAGLRMDFHPLATDTPDALAVSIAAAFCEFITGLPGRTAGAETYRQLGRMAGGPGRSHDSFWMILSCPRRRQFAVPGTGWFTAAAVDHGTAALRFPPEGLGGSPCPSVLIGTGT